MNQCKMDLPLIPNYVVSATASTPVLLNPNKLDIHLFNKLFEENKLPDSDIDDGYGDWLKTQEPSSAYADVETPDSYKTFEQLSNVNNLPCEMTSTPHFGAELVGSHQYTKVPSRYGGIGYTDLKYAYGEGSTFSQGVAGVTLDSRPKNLEEAKREYGTAPPPMSAQESVAVAAFEHAKEEAEAKRRQRVADRDVDTEQTHARIKSRLIIQS